MDNLLLIMIALMLLQTELKELMKVNCQSINEETKKPVLGYTEV